jgi:hypothetical protein
MPVTLNVVELMVAEFMGSENTAVIFELIATPVALLDVPEIMKLLDGIVDRMVGAVLSGAVSAPHAARNDTSRIETTNLEMEVDFICCPP